VKSLSQIRLLVTPWTAAYQAPPSMGFSRQEYWSGVPLPSPVWMWELEYKESWVQNNWCFWTVVLEETLESPLDCIEIQPVHPKGDQPWVFIGRTDVEAETPMLWPPDKKSWLIWKDPDAGKDWRQEEKGMTEDEIVGWHHWLDGRGFWWTPGIGDGQGGLACCGSWGRKESDTTEWLNWTELNNMVCLCEYLAFLSLSVYFHPNCITCAPWGYKNCILFFLHSSQPLLQHIESAE